MSGHVPRAGFLKWVRPQVFPLTKTGKGGKTVKTSPTVPIYGDKRVASDYRRCRGYMLHDFQWAGKGTSGSKSEEDALMSPSFGPTTRSSTAADTNWLLDEEAFSVSTTDRRRLSRLAIESLMISPVGTKLILLVCVKDDDKLLGGRGAHFSQFQENNATTISGRNYFTIEVVVSECRQRLDVLSGGSFGYTLNKFENDFSGGHAGFSVVASGCSGCLTFTWKEVANHPTSFMFFGAPTSPRCFDVVFKDVTDKNKLHHRFLQFYDEFEGDSVACLALHNSYVMARLVAEGKASKLKPKKTLFAVPGDLLLTKKVKDFCKDFDLLFEVGIKSVFTEFKRHFEPIVNTQKVLDFMGKAPDVFGSWWDMRCCHRGVGNDTSKKHSLFFCMLAEIRNCHKFRLKHWALVNNISDYCRGSKTVSENMACYFGHHVHPNTRRRVLGDCAGTTKTERAKGNTLASKQRRLLSACRSVIICYDNFQRGVTMQDQRGRHSSAFFKGTHQCAHKVKPFNDIAFDSHYVPVTYVNQQIPSPWGMPAYEEWDENDSSDFS